MDFSFRNCFSVMAFSGSLSPLCFSLCLLSSTSSISGIYKLKLYSFLVIFVNFFIFFLSVWFQFSSELGEKQVLTKTT